MTKEQHDRILEIQARLSKIEEEKKSYRAKLGEIEKREEASADDVKELESINTSLDDLSKEAKSLRAELGKLQSEPEELKKVDTSFRKSEEKKMNRDEAIKSELYARAWAKHYLKRSMSNAEKEAFDIVNKRAEGVATTTTAADYVAPTSDDDGINNGGVFVPTSLSLDVLNELEQISPFFQKIRKISAKGGINYPYSESNSGAKWYAEGTATEDQSIKFATLSLAGYELAKYIRITWKLEAMAVDGFLNYIRDELVNECGRALIKAVLYGVGAGSNQPTGATVGALKVTSAGYSDLMDEMEKTPAKLVKSGRKDAIIGAEFFVSPDVMDNITFAKDDNGKYQFNALVAPNTFGAYKLNVDPFLEEGDFVFGNARNYILNEQIPVGVMIESEAKFRRNGYSAYGVYDGKPIPKAFVYGTKA